MLDYESKQSIQPRMGKRSNDETRKPSGARFGEFNFRLVIARIDPTQLAIFGNDDAVGIGRNRIVEDSSHFRAHFRAFDSIPSSVFKSNDRGSKLNDPMNTVLPSTVKALA